MSKAYFLVDALWPIPFTPNPEKD